MPQIRDLLTELTIGFVSATPPVNQSRNPFQRSGRREETERAFGATYTPTDQLKHLFKILELNGNENYDGTVKDAADFVDWLGHTVNARDKPGVHKERQGKALKFISLTLKMPLVSVFSQIDPAKFYFQLAVRILKPELIHQRQTGLCAVTAWITQMARTEADEFCVDAINLFRNGFCVINGIEVRAHRFMTRGLSVGDLAECDYVVLTSARNSAAILRKYEAVQGLPMLRVAKALWLTGYRDIDFCIKDTEGITEIDEPSLRKMANRLHAGHNMLMADDQQICLAAWHNRPISPTEGDGAHLSYVTKMRLDEKYIREIKIFTSGKACQGRDILIAEALPHLLGLITYRDRS